MRVRLADMSDRDRLFEWRNDPLTRANSRHTAEVPYLTHVQFSPETRASEIAVLEGMATRYTDRANVQMHQA